MRHRTGWRVTEWLVSNWQALLAAIGVLLGSIGGLSGLYTAWSSRRKLDAEALKLDAEAEVTLTGATLEFAKEIRAEMEARDVRHAREVDALRKRVAHLEQGIAKRDEIIAQQLQEIATLKQRIDVLEAHSP